MMSFAEGCVYLMTFYCVIGSMFCFWIDMRAIIKPWQLWTAWTVFFPIAFLFALSSLLGTYAPLFCKKVLQQWKE